MKIMLASPVLTLDNFEHNKKAHLETITKAGAAKVDLVAFSEASLSGFEALSFNYKEDLDVTLGLHGPEISEIREAAKLHKVAVSLGFYENDGGGFYSTYLVVDMNGDIANKYHRVSPTWKESHACADYREGRRFETFDLLDKRIATLVCGDLWTDSLIPEIVDLDPEVDFFLWPVHVDLSVEDWQTDNRDYADPDNVSKSAYIHQSSILVKPVLFINTYVEDTGRAKGGVYLWHRGKEIAALEMGESGTLTVEI